MFLTGTSHPFIPLYSEPFTGSLTLPMKTRMSLYRSDQNTDNCLQVSWYHRSSGPNSPVSSNSTESLPHPPSDTMPAVRHKRVNSGSQWGQKTAPARSWWKPQAGDEGKDFNEQNPPNNTMYSVPSLMKISCNFLQDYWESLQLT